MQSKYDNKSAPLFRMTVLYKHTFINRKIMQINRFIRLLCSQRKGLH